jgi:mannosyltransferase OCH1-like enzyme
MGITKIIHQSWKTKYIPHNIYPQSWIDSWKLFHPDWEWKLWTDGDNDHLVREHYPSFYECYRSLLLPIKKADFVRHLYMHRFGGVYVDLDFVCLKNITCLLKEYDIVLGCLSPENPRSRIPNAFMASSPGCRFWIQILEDIVGATPDEQARVETHTGPIRLERAYERYNPSNSKVYGHHLIYPLDWIDLFRPSKREFALTLRRKSPDELACLFPDSYCLTFWVHNWRRH